MLEKFILEKSTNNKLFTLNELQEKMNDLRELIYKCNNPEYLYWTDIKYKSWIKEKINPEDFWQILNFSRSINSNIISDFKTESGKNFVYNNLEHFDSILKEIDNFKLDNTDYKNFFIKNNLIEEGIASSQLEGAHTTREVAKNIIKCKKPATNENEIMIVNNYEAMQALENKYKYQDLSINMILELHTIFLKNDKNIEKNKIGCFRDEKDEIYVGNNNYYTHKAPEINYAKNELNKLIDFANNNKNYHPIITAIIIHCLIAYLHLFVDGNGRLSRCLFYWYLLRNNYDYMIFFPISRIIKKSQKQYSNSFIYFQQNDFDMTYIFDYNLRKIQQAKNEFNEYYNKKIIELESQEKDIFKLIKDNNFNTRQEKVINDLFLNKIPYLTINYMTNIYNITRQTASNDLKDLENKNLLTSKKVGREVRYYKNENR